MGVSDGIGVAPIAYAICIHPRHISCIYHAICICVMFMYDICRMHIAYEFNQLNVNQLVVGTFRTNGAPLHCPPKCADHFPIAYANPIN